MGTKEAAKLWGYTQATIADWCRKGLIEGADHDGKAGPCLHDPQGERVVPLILSIAQYPYAMHTGTCFFTG